MYSVAGPATTLGATLPRQVRPPAWLRNIAGAVLRGTQVTVPTPAGPQTFDLYDPAGAAKLKAMAEQAKAILAQSTFTLSRRPSAAATAAGKVNQAVTENVPGGWATVIGGGVALFFIAKAMMGRR
jgi:hypothetical protein